jgi:hypothetical protein
MQASGVPRDDGCCMPPVPFIVRCPPALPQVLGLVSILAATPDLRQLLLQPSRISNEHLSLAQVCRRAQGVSAHWASLARCSGWPTVTAGVA